MTHTRSHTRRHVDRVYTLALIDVTHEKLAATSAGLAYISIGRVTSGRTLLRNSHLYRCDQSNILDFIFFSFWTGASSRTRAWRIRERRERYRLMNNDFVVVVVVVVEYNNNHLSTRKEKKNSICALNKVACKLKWKSKNNYIRKQNKLIYKWVHKYMSSWVKNKY